MEQWKDVVGYEGYYEVSDHGNVRSLDKEVRTNIRHVKSRIIKGKVLKPYKKNHGYYAVSLSKDGKWFTTEIHRLVAKAFLPNPMNKKVVNHKDGNKLNNHIDNLEWTSYKENHWHAREIQLLVNVGQHASKKIKCVETNTEFDNSARAAEWIINQGNLRSSSKNLITIAGNIRRCINGGTPKAYGYHWIEI